MSSASGQNNDSSETMMIAEASLHELRTALQAQLALNGRLKRQNENLQAILGTTGIFCETHDPSQPPTVTLRGLPPSDSIGGDPPALCPLCRLESLASVASALIRENTWLATDYPEGTALAQALANAGYPLTLNNAE